jgi:hypothetical protein
VFLNRLLLSSKARLVSAPRTRPGVRLSLEPLVDRIVPAKLSAGHTSINEGTAGTQYALVRVNMDAPGKQAVTVNYATADGTATAGSDYGAVSGRLAFAPGETTKTIAVPVYGDRRPESDETFLVNLKNAQGAKIANGTAVVTIVDSSPRIRIDDPYVNVGYLDDGHTLAGTTLSFTVSLSAAYDESVTVNYATADGTVVPQIGASPGVAGVNYRATAGTLTFAPGETTKTITVDVLGGPQAVECVFSMNLSGASSNAQIIDGLGIGAVFVIGSDGGDGGGYVNA